MNIIASFFNLLFPKLCPVCKNRVDNVSNPVCLSCLLSLPLYVNNNFRDNDIMSRLCGTCRIEKASSAFYYFHGSDLHCIVEKFKYRGDADLAVYMGKITADLMCTKGFFSDIECIVPLPLHKNRKRKRGYNQAEKIAEGIFLKTGLPVFDVLERIVDNKSQTNLSAGERIQNVAGIFRLKNIDGCEGKHVLLVDDILTTGSTMMAAAEVLSGIASKISILTLASTAG